MAKIDQEPQSVFIIGNDARANVYAYLLRKTGVPVFMAPGNGGTSPYAQRVEIGMSIDNLRRFADEHNSLTVPSSETWFAEGIVDAFREDRLPIFGPTQAAARLESSKMYSTKLMESAGIPHPDSFVATTYSEALGFAKIFPWRGGMAVKGNDLAGGKAVEMVSNPEQAEEAVKNVLVDNKYGKHAGVVFQEWVRGKEVSVIAITDGTFDEKDNPTLKYFPYSQDHKDLLDGNKGPKTGGMGAYAEVPFIDAQTQQIVDREIIKPALKALRDEGHPFTGALYAGLMLTKEGPKVLEFNVRFGDPEIQALGMLVNNRTNFFSVLHSCTNQTLKRQRLEFYKNQSAAAVVLAARGYPEKPIKGQEIYLDRVRAVMDGIEVFQAGTKLKDGKLITDGGRVLTVAARRWSINSARNAVYAFIEAPNVFFEGQQYRNDIAANIN